MNEEEKTYGGQFFNDKNKTVSYPYKFPSKQKKSKSKKESNQSKKGENK